MFCPKCGAPNDDRTWRCAQCHTPLRAVPSRVAFGPPEVIPNYLVRAIVCTVFCCVPLGIPAIVYAAQVNNKVAQGDLAGARHASTNAKMWCWIAFAVGIVFSLIYMAIAIPNLLRARMAANEVSAIGSMRTLNTAALTYAEKYNQGYPPGLAALGPAPANGTADARAANLIDAVLASGQKSGYFFTYSAGERDADGRVKTYAIYAEPVKPGNTGQKYYFTDQTGVIRQEANSPASEQSPPISR